MFISTIQRDCEASLARSRKRRQESEQERDERYLGLHRLTPFDLAAILGTALIIVVFLLALKIALS